MNEKEKKMIEGTILEEVFANNFGALIEPNFPITRGEKVIGEMDKVEKRLYTLFYRYLELNFKIDDFRDLMWTFIRYRFKKYLRIGNLEIGNLEIGIRKGWKIVKVRPFSLF